MKIVLSLAALLFGQFALASNSDLVNISISPQIPIVIEGDVIHGNTTIHAPWFRFQPLFSNNSAKDLVIVALSIQVYPTDGTKGYNNASIVPTNFNYESNKGECTYSYFDVIPAGAQNQDLAVTPDQKIKECVKSSAMTYVGSNPLLTNNSGYRYRVDVTPQGWFGTLDNPGERLQKTFTFYTQ